MTEPTSPSRPDQPGFLPPEQPAAPAPQQAAWGYGPTGQPTGPADIPTEKVGRGILFALAAVVLGALLAGGLYQLGYIASITSFAMAAGAGWLYSKGAGAPPKAGVWALIGVIALGVVLSLFVMLGWELYAEIAAEYPEATFGDIMPFVLQLLFDGEVWGNFAKDAGMFVLFAALGTFATLRQLGRGRAAASA